MTIKIVRRSSNGEHIVTLILARKIDLYTETVSVTASLNLKHLDIANALLIK